METRGAVGLDWQVAGFGPLSGAGRSDMLMRNSTGAFMAYDIANNQITGAAPMGAVGLNWQVGGIAPDLPGGGASTSQLVQAMAGCGGGSGAADNVNNAFPGADMSQQQFLTTPQHA